MDIKHFMNTKYTSAVYDTARWINGTQAERICQLFQRQWDEGGSFLGLWGSICIRDRESDSEEEISACAKQLYNSLVIFVRTEWLQNLSRDLASDILTILEINRIKDPPRLGICPGINFDAADIVNGWNSYHPNQKPLNLKG